MRAMAGAGLLTTTLIVSACAVGPDPGPDLVSGDHGENPATSSSATPPPPALTAPRQDLAWRECGSATAARFGVTAPPGAIVECAEFDSPVDPAQPDDETLTVAATRVRTSATPADAAPLVLTTGSDMPSSLSLIHI